MHFEFEKPLNTNPTKNKTTYFFIFIFDLNHLINILYNI